MIDLKVSSRIGMTADGTTAVLFCQEVDAKFFGQNYATVELVPLDILRITKGIASNTLAACSDDTCGYEWNATFPNIPSRTRRMLIAHCLDFFSSDVTMLEYVVDDTPGTLAGDGIDGLLEAGVEACELVTFKRLDLVDKMNKILKKHHPDALPPSPKSDQR